MTDTPLDFSMVELVRERMELTIVEMATMLGVSRAGYYKWLNGNVMRSSNEKRVKETLRVFLPLLKEGHWPPKGAKAMTSEQRLGALLEILAAEE